MEQGRNPSQTRVHLLLTPDFNMCATMGFVDPLRAANYLEGVPLFRWAFLSEEGGLVRASNGAVIETKPLSEVRRSLPDILMVSSSWEPEVHVSTSVRHALSVTAGRQAILGGIDTGAFVLAHAGLLKGHRATVHYEHFDAFRELFPETEVLETLWVFDGQRITCCGGSASVDFGLHVVRRRYGRSLADAAARYIFVHDPRDHGTPQNPRRVEEVSASLPLSVRKAIHLMEENLETPMRVPDVCRSVGLSHRQLNRLFAQYIGRSPALYYRDARLDRARGLVTQTHMSMAEIAYACGFSSQVHFSRAYKERFRLPPSKDRIEGRIPFEFRPLPIQGGASGDGQKS